MSRWKPGERVAGRFSIEGWLASGGMAEVYVAKMAFARGVERRVALKRIHSNLAEDPHFISMFLDEARLASQLVHPGVIPVHDVVEADGELLLVLDFVPGWDLSTVLKKLRERGETPPIGACLFVGRAVAETLSYVHGANDLHGRPLGIVHRDVNPSNILIAEDGSVRLLDFGVAKVAQSTQHTATRGIKGKLAYLSPEQAKSGVIDARTDLYGLGLLLFEMASGTRALHATGDLALLEVARAPKIPRASSMRGDLPGAFDLLIASLLEIDPARRPRNAAEVARAIEEIGASSTDANREAVRAMVLRAMETPSRPIKVAQRPLDAALAAIVGIDAGQRTAPELEIEIDVHDTAPAAPPAPVRAPARRAPFAIVLGFSAAAIAAIAAYSWGIGATRDGAPVEVRAELGHPENGFVRIVSRPPGAEVTVDGTKLRDRTPLVFESIAGQRRAISLSLEDHVATSTSVASIEGRTTDVEVELARKRGRLTVRSTPEATVQIDGRDAGSTPLTLEDLPRAAVKVRIESAGYLAKELDAALDVEPDKELDVVLEREVATGLLDVSSTPWARVTVDGRVVAESTPALGVRLPAGTHTVVLSNPRLNKQVKRVVKIERGKRASVIVRF